MLSEKRLEHLRRVAKLGGHAKAKIRKPVIDRFIENIVVAKPGGCWLWTKGKGRGYGRFKINGKLTLATRWSFEYFNQVKISNSKLFVCHSCDVRACVNPDHLFLGTTTDNIKNASKKGILSHGKKHWASKDLTNQIKEIMSSWYSGESYQKIGNKYGVSWKTIERICSGTHWTVRQSPDYHPLNETK